MAKVLLKKSSVSSNAPGTGDLDYGEIAINYADGRLYYKNSSNLIKNFVDSDILKAYVDAGDAIKINRAGDTMSGVLSMGTNRIIDVSDPANAQDAATKQYVDAAVAAGAGTVDYPIGDYGRVDSSASIDAFGVFTALSGYDHMDPSGSIVTIDHGTDSSI